jgi:hypothetical protein
MHQVGTQFWQKTRCIPRSLALLTLAMASNSSIKQSDELKFYSMDIVCVAHGFPEILSTSNTPMTIFMLWSHLRLSLLAYITSWEISNHNTLDATIYYMGSVQCMEEGLHVSILSMI